MLAQLCLFAGRDDGYRVVCEHTTRLRSSDPPRAVTEIGAKLGRAEVAEVRQHPLADRLFGVRPAHG